MLLCSQKAFILHQQETLRPLWCLGKCRSHPEWDLHTCPVSTPDWSLQKYDVGRLRRVHLRLSMGFIIEGNQAKNTWGINRLMSSLVFSSIFSIKWWPKNVTFYGQHDWTMKWILDLLRHFHWIIPKLQCSGPSFLIHTRPLLPYSNGCNTHPYDSAFHSQMDESYLVLWLKIRLSTPNRLITDPVSF